MLNGLDCQKCNKQLRKVRGCEELDEPIEIEGIEVDRCPKKLITMQSSMMLEAYSQFKAGFLPNNGGSLNQPIKFSEAMRVIEAAIERLERKKK